MKLTMTMIPPELMCTKHLIAEHNAIHELAMAIDTQKIDLAGKIMLGSVEPSYLGFRHDEIAKELLDRGEMHFSSMDQPTISYLPIMQQLATVNWRKWRSMLLAECEDCLALHKESRDA